MTQCPEELAVEMDTERDHVKCPKNMKNIKMNNEFGARMEEKQETNNKEQQELNNETESFIFMEGVSSISIM